MAKNTRLRIYFLLTGLGFFAVIVVGIVFYIQFYNLSLERDRFTREFFTEYINHINQNTLSRIASYIEREYPVLRDTERLKHEAGTDWFWETSEEITGIARTFGVAYIYYIQKTETGYSFLMSSGIGRDNHPEWLGGPVWEGPAPAFIDEAWAAGRLTFSPEPVVNEWGTLISAELPILEGGQVVGILGVDYDISTFMESTGMREQILNQREAALLRKLLTNIIIFVIVVAAIMAAQILLDYKSVLVPARSIEALERNRVMMDATPMVCSIWDEDGRMLDCNLEALRVFGLSDKSEYIEHFFDLCPEYQSDGQNTQEKAAGLIKAAFETGYQRFEWMYLTAKGEPLPVETTLVRVPWEGRFCITAYSRDLREIREAEERLRVMVDEMAFACIFFDGGGNPLDCNQRTVDLYECGGKQNFLDHFFDFSPEYQSNGQKSRERSVELIRDTYKTGKNVFKWDHLRGDGSLLPVEVTLRRVKWEDGYRVIAYVQDLSELMETTENLIRMSAIVEASPSFIVYVGAEDEIEYMNPAVSNLSEASKAELLRSGLEHISLESGIVQFEINLGTRENENRDFMFLGFPIHIHSGKSGIGLLGRDITELKGIQRDLVAAKEQAERALSREVYYNKAKSDFLSRVSHEMRTPLNAIIGMTGAAKKAAPGEEQDQCFEKLKEASEHLLDIVNDMLDMTSLGAGEVVLAREPFSFGGLMAQVIEPAETQAKAQGLRFAADIDGGIPDTLINDERRLKQILSKLLSNAVKFTPAGGTVGLSASMIENRKSDCLIRFVVNDTGIGIGEETRRRIWEAFEQADNSITRKYEGMGLSLPLVKRVVDMMYGSIELESELGKGSRFICDLRFGIAHIPVNGGKKTGTGEAGGTPDLRGRKILVVDDVELNRDIVFALLEDTGAQYDGAGGGAEAVEMFVQNKYDLVFMDLHMPDMDGLEATRQIRLRDFFRAKTTPVISLSADDSADMRARCRLAGINDHLTKPIDTETLFRMIRRWL